MIFVPRSSPPFTKQRLSLQKPGDYSSLSTPNYPITESSYHVLTVCQRGIKIFRIFLCPLTLYVYEGAAIHALAGRPKTETVTLAGNLCTAADIIARDIFLPPGDGRRHSNDRCRQLRRGALPRAVCVHGASCPAVFAAEGQPVNMNAQKPPSGKLKNAAFHGSLP